MAPRTSSWPVWSGILSTDNNIKSADDWIEARRQEDGADELWRIHDGLYNLEQWIPKHPGGSQWLEITKVCIYYLFKNVYFKHNNMNENNTKIFTII